MRLAMRRTALSASSRAPPHPRPAPPSFGNQARLRQLQKKLEIGATNDPLEHEADRAADQVMQRPEPGRIISPAPLQISRKCGTCEEADEGALQRKGEAGATPAGAKVPHSVPRALQSPGQTLDAGTRGFMESGFGHDFSAVRIHNDATAAASARAIGALAYTHGNDVVFAPGQYAPGSAAGQRLLAHELTHVLQQNHGQIRRKPPDEPEAETQDPPVDKFKGSLVSRVTIVLSDKSVVFQTALGPVKGTVDTDLTAGDYTITPDLAKKTWAINGPNVKSGLRFVVDLEGAIPWALSYPAALPLAVADTPPAEPAPAAATPVAPMVGHAASPAAIHGATVWYNLQSLPHADRSEQTFHAGPYRMVPMLRHEADGSFAIVYFTAFRERPGIGGPTNWNEWAIGPDEIDAFLANVEVRAAGNAMAYMFGPPAPNAVEGSKFVESALAGEFGDAESHYGSSLLISVKDPMWWVALLTPIVGGIRVPAATTEAAELGGSIKPPPIEPAEAPNLFEPSELSSLRNIPPANDVIPPVANDVTPGAAPGASPAAVPAAPRPLTLVKPPSGGAGNVVGRMPNAAWDAGAARALAPAADPGAALPAPKLQAVPNLPEVAPAPAPAVPVPKPLPLTPPETLPAAPPAPELAPAPRPAPLTQPLIPTPVITAIQAAKALNTPLSTDPTVAAGARAPKPKPVMPTDLSPADQKQWNDCSKIYDTYKLVTSAEVASRAAIFKTFLDNISNNRNTQQNIIDLCAMIDDLIKKTNELITGRADYINTGCDKFDWYNEGKTEAERRTKHVSQLENVKKQLANQDKTAKKYCNK